MSKKRTSRKGASRKRADDGDVKEGGRMKGTSRKGADESDIKEWGRMKGK